ncbi:YopX family protein [Staphylococcus sp. GRT3]|uniref:YopX family protein n=2 Tax=Staphylococcus americanisciuri TaxID=2973940 RepID=A0ABT2F1R0_9STAP|nr:YopX family protein [Staphylococcus americanisciuri]
MLLKFRVWNEKQKKMFNYKDILEVYPNRRELLVSEPFINMDKSSFGLKLYRLTFDEVDIMAATGVFDENDVEVYEGDIVRFRYRYDKRISDDGVIIWMSDKACFGIELLYTHEKYELHQIMKDHCLESLCNICEHPHLLKEDE